MPFFIHIFFIDEFIEKVTHMKKYLFAGPFIKLMEGTDDEVKEMKPLQFEIKPGEFMWFVPKADRSFICGFSNVVSDKTDLPIAKVMYHVC